MITFASANQGFTATYQGDYYDLANTIVNGYKSSRTMLRVKRENNPQLSFVYVVRNENGSAETTIYYTDPDGVLEIPLHDAINGMKADNVYTVAVLNIDGSDVDGGIQFTVHPVPGVSYKDLPLPRNKDAAQFFAAYGQYVLPPNIILNPAMLAGVSAPGIIVESNFADSDAANVAWSVFAGGVGATVTPSGDRSNQLAISAGAETLRLSDGTNAKDWELQKPDYCSDLVCIRWTSQTGAVRQHCFPVVAYIKGSDTQTSLVTPGDGYDVRKDTFEGVRCRLTGLTPYSMWYYADLLQASDAHAVIHPTQALWETEIASAQTACFIEGNNMETPQGNGFYNFEFTAKLKHYASN